MTLLELTLRRLLGRNLIMYSTVRCPNCGKRSHDLMPRNACVYFYHCLRCNAVFKPRNGDCCVYCSYGDVPCPDRQTVRRERRRGRRIGAPPRMVKNSG